MRGYLFSYILASIMLMIRLRRVGRKNDPNFQVVLVDKRRAPKSGAFLELLGSYDPHKKTLNLKKDRITHWIGKGAQPSDTVHNMLLKQKLISGSAINVVPAPKKAEEAPKVEAAASA